MRANTLTALIGVGAGLMVMSAQAALVSTDGGLGVYDTTNNVTWTSNANLMATQAANYSGGAAAFVSAVIADSSGIIHDAPNQYDNPAGSGSYTLSAGDFITTTGQMDWWGAQAWVHYLDVTNYGGSNQWALPTTIDSKSSLGYPNGGALSPSQSSSQLAQLFYGNLGQVANDPIASYHNASYSLFSDMLSDEYLSGTESSAATSASWYFDSYDGSQATVAKYDFGYALAVSSGQVSAVPLPGAAWLLGSGLLVLVGLGRRKAETLALR